MKFRGRKKTPRRVTIKPDGSVDLFGYPLVELLMLSQHPAFRPLLREARENPPAEAEVRDLDWGRPAFGPIPADTMRWDK